MTDPSSPMPLPSGQPVEFCCRVTYRMTDQMGVVYYGNYLELFEIGRTELLRTLGLTYRQMEQDGYLLPVIHAAADYLAPARYDDLLRIRTWVARLSRVRLDFRYEIQRVTEPADAPEGCDPAANGPGLLCRGVTHHAIIGPNGRPRRLDQLWMDRLAPFITETDSTVP